MGRANSIIEKFPSFYQSEDIGNNFYQFISVFGKMLDKAEADLIKVMRSHWVNTADNEGSRGFDTAQKGDLDKIFSLYIENLGGTSLLKQIDRRGGEKGLIDDEIYRQRIKGLIQVISSGASTRNGIIDIVAANLGIVGDSPEVRKAKEQIEIIEFLPDLVKTDTMSLALHEVFQVNNPNKVPVIPEVRVVIRGDVTTPLINPTIVNVSTGASVRYPGTILAGDALSFFTDGTAFLNGVEVILEGSTPELLPGHSRWRLEASIGLPEGRFDLNRYNYSLFDIGRLSEIGRYDNSHFDEAVFTSLNPVADVSLSFDKLNPATFMVKIPWDIPGFTERLEDLADQPRNQIKYIVNKVKAAGVLAIVAYEKRFEEIHQLGEHLTLKIPRSEDHQIEEANFDLGSIHTPYTGGIEHEMQDTITLSGVFDYTGFDSLNTFA